MTKKELAKKLFKMQIGWEKKVTQETKDKAFKKMLPAILKQIDVVLKAKLK